LLTFAEIFAAQGVATGITTPAVPVAKFCTSGTSGNFAAGVVDTGGKFAPVSLISVVHIDLRMSPPSFAQILKDPYVIFRGFGKMIHEKSEAKNLVTLSLLRDSFMNLERSLF
jgi:hypothetical protein